MKKEYIKPNTEVKVTSLQLCIDPPSTFSQKPEEEEYNDEFGSKSRDTWSEEGLW